MMCLLLNTSQGRNICRYQLKTRIRPKTTCVSPSDVIELTGSCLEPRENFSINNNRPIQRIFHNLQIIYYYERIRMKVIAIWDLPVVYHIVDTGIIYDREENKNIKRCRKMICERDYYYYYYIKLIEKTILLIS